MPDAIFAEAASLPFQYGGFVDKPNANHHYLCMLQCQLASDELRQQVVLAMQTTHTVYLSLQVRERGILLGVVSFY